GFAAGRRAGPFTAFSDWNRPAPGPVPRGVHTAGGTDPPGSDFHQDSDGAGLPAGLVLKLGYSESAAGKAFGTGSVPTRGVTLVLLRQLGPQQWRDSLPFLS